MPGITPVYGLTYPVDGDSLSAAVKTIPQQLATDVESTIAGLSGLPAPGAWTNATLTNGWLALVGGWHTPGYRKVGTRVTLRGAVANGSSGFAAFVLPVGSRPTANRRFLVPSTHASGFSAVQVRADDGAVFTDGNSVGGSGNFYHLDAISFDL